MRRTHLLRSKFKGSGRAAMTCARSTSESATLQPMLLLSKRVRTLIAASVIEIVACSPTTIMNAQAPAASSWIGRGEPGA